MLLFKLIFSTSFETSLPFVTLSYRPLLKQPCHPIFAMQLFSPTIQKEKGQNFCHGLHYAHISYKEQN